MKPANPEDVLFRLDNRKKPENQKYVTISKIIVPTEQDKQQLLAAFEYIHYLSDIDPDYMAVNTIMHIYTRPDLIEIQQS